MAKQKPKYNYDVECELLARSFLLAHNGDRDPQLPPAVYAPPLAQAIQDAIEQWFYDELGVEAKIAARKSARKEISFQQRKAQRDADAGPTGTSEAPAGAGGTDSAKPAKPATDGGITADIEGHMAWLRDWAGPTGTEED